MVCLSRNGSGRYRFVLRPNSSLSWRGTVLAFSALSVLPLTVATALAWQGLWPVLPFAGAELLALGTAFIVCGRRGSNVEVVTIDSVAVAVEKGRGYPADIWNLPRGWVGVSLQAARHRGHPSRLMLASHGTAVRLGDFLTDDERERVARELRSVLRNV